MPGGGEDSGVRFLFSLVIEWRSEMGVYFSNEGAHCRGRHPWRTPDLRKPPQLQLHDNSERSGAGIVSIGRTFIRVRHLLAWSNS